MYTNEINQEKLTFHLYNYIYKREKKKPIERIEYVVRSSDKGYYILNSNNGFN